MVTCTICQKQFKTAQGLSGHNFFVHSNSGGSFKNSAAQPAEQASGFSFEHLSSAPHRLSNQEQRITMLEQATGVAQPEDVDRLLSINAKPLTEQVAQLAEQLEASKASSVSQAEFGRVCDRQEELCRGLINLESRYNSILETVAAHNTQLDEKAEKTVALNSQAQIQKLAKALAGYNQIVKSQSDFQEQIMKIISNISNNCLDALKSTNQQVLEQKRVTDWVKKKFELVPVKA